MGKNVANLERQMPFRNIYPHKFQILQCSYILNVNLPCQNSEMVDSPKFYPARILCYTVQHLRQKQLYKNLQRYRLLTHLIKIKSTVALSHKLCINSHTCSVEWLLLQRNLQPRWLIAGSLLTSKR